MHLETGVCVCDTRYDMKPDNNVEHVTKLPVHCHDYAVGLYRLILTSLSFPLRAVVSVCRPSGFYCIQMCPLKY
jgi:hypothetical protein